MWTKIFHLEFAAYHQGWFSSREFVAKLWKSHGWSVNQQIASCFWAYGIISIYGQNLLLSPKEISFSSSSQTLGDLWLRSDDECACKRDDLIWCGDGRFDSMGHCVKYGAYTMFCPSIMKIVHFEIVQVRFIWNRIKQLLYI